MYRAASFALFAALAFGQPNEPFKPKPPAQVDAELRARVNEFFDLHVKGQFRKAEELVAEDTKDYFYSGNKPKYLSFEISKIDYSANFTRAKVLVVCEQNLVMPGFAGVTKVPSLNTWKLENGKWYWHVDEDDRFNTPWGKMTPGPSSPTGKPVALAAIPTSADFTRNQVRFDKSAISVKAGQPATVIITNGAAGPVSLSVPAALPGLEAKLDKSELPAGGKATLTLLAAKGAKPGVVTVRVEPIMQLLPLEVMIVD
jgi:hypothetical protein